MGARQRDEEFEELVRAAWPRLRRAACLLTHDTHEDLVQTALTRSHARWGQVRREGAYSCVHPALVNASVDSTQRRDELQLAPLVLDVGRDRTVEVRERSYES